MATPISAGLDNVLILLRQRRGDRSSFPRGFTLEGGRVGKSESIGMWFKRCVDELLGGDVGRCKVEDHLALFAVVHWRDKQTMSHVSCQAVIVQQGIVDHLYRDPGLRAQYLRLDYDLTALGAMFREPTPHVHVHPDGEPRFGLPTSRNVLMDFLDFVYRNYCYETWLRWATSVWEREARLRGRDPAIIEQVQRAFDTANCAALGRFSADLDRMKRAWRAERDALWPHVVPDRETSLLCYEPTG